jgi:hypothetical protein
VQDFFAPCLLFQIARLPPSVFILVKQPCFYSVKTKETVAKRKLDDMKKMISQRS